MLGLMEISTGNMPCTMHQTNTRGLVTARAPHFYFPWEIIARFGYSAPYLMLKKDIYALFHENEGNFLPILSNFVHNLGVLVVCHKF